MVGGYSNSRPFLSVRMIQVPSNSLRIAVALFANLLICKGSNINPNQLAEWLLRLKG